MKTWEVEAAKPWASPAKKWDFRGSWPSGVDEDLDLTINNRDEAMTKSMNDGFGCDLNPRVELCKSNLW